MQSEKTLWDDTKALLETPLVSFGTHWSYNFRNDPKRLAFVLSRYKFAAKMASKNSRVLELGCSEGIGAPILAEQALSYLGVDLDTEAIVSAKNTFENSKISFCNDDFMDKSYGVFDTIVSLDVIEHIHAQFESIYFSTIINNLAEDGVCLIGTPNITAATYASTASQLGHVNLFSQERLLSLMKNYFHQVLPFGMNDEIVHTGYPAMSHFLFCVGFYKK